jgi:predicted TIM-barrel fold metal-dependent hydrolase
MTSNDRVIVAGSDSHVSPPLVDLRPYCRKQYLDDFDAYLAVWEEETRQTNELIRQLSEDGTQLPQGIRSLKNGMSMGGHGDPHVRLEDFDREGVAAEVIFHGTQGDTRGGMHASHPMPWSLSDRSLVAKPGDSTLSVELATEGRRIFNRWMADFVSVQPERHAALAYIPTWDIDAAVEELHWANEHGLRGVNFPSPGASFGGLTLDTISTGYPPFEDPYWAPLFDTAAELNMPLTTHVGHPMLPPYYNGPGAFAITVFEQMQLSGRSMWHLLFSGCFDRHPNLKIVTTEVLGPWWVNVVEEMASTYEGTGVGPSEMLRAAIKKHPNEYVKENCYFGTSFMSRPEAQYAIDMDLTDRVIWGSDYPHYESTWHPDPDAYPVTKLSLANTFHDMEEDQVRDMVGRNMIECYGLSEPALAEVADRIGPTITELLTEPDLSLLSPDYIGKGFRDKGHQHT